MKRELLLADRRLDLSVRHDSLPLNLILTVVNLALEILFRVGSEVTSAQGLESIDYPVVILCRKLFGIRLKLEIDVYVQLDWPIGR